MELTEEMRYRLSYLALRLLCDAKLARDLDKLELTGLLELLDLMSGSELATSARDPERKYMSQRAKLEDFIDAEFGEEVLAVVNRAIAELV